RGALHSERNGSETEGMRFLQFWILPSQEDLENSVQQRQYTEADRRGRVLQIMGPVGEDGLDLAQDARVSVSRLTGGDHAHYAVAAGRGGYPYVLHGDLQLWPGGLSGGDAAQIPRPQGLPLAPAHDPGLGPVDVPRPIPP